MRYIISFPDSFTVWTCAALVAAAMHDEMLQQQQQQALERAMEEWEDKNRRIKIVKAALQKNAQQS